MGRREHLSEFAGLYYGMGIALDVTVRDDLLEVGMVGVPPGLESPLVPIDADTFRMRTGPLAGAAIAFSRTDEGEVAGVTFGPFDLRRVEAAELAGLPLVERLLAPPFDLTPEKEKAFAALLEEALALGPDAFVTYQLNDPLWEFVAFLNQQNRYLFHSTSQMALTELRPERTSMELGDETGRGNMAAVYATQDGLWSMFFAILDRKALQGSIRNGVLNFQDANGATVPVYNFSIDQNELAKKPYSPGAMYILPRDSFVQLELMPGVLSNEWVSEQPVRPLAKLFVTPEDFPFLDRIGGHDDGPLLRFNELGRQLRAEATYAQLANGSLEIQLRDSPHMRAAIDEYIALLQDTLPVVAADTRDDQGGIITLKLANLPPAVQQMVATEYAALLTSNE